MAKLDAQSIINYIGSAKKKTPVKVYVKGQLDQLNVPDGIKTFSVAMRAFYSVIGPTLNHF